MAPCVDLGGGCVDQRTIVVESPKRAVVIDGEAGLNALQRILEAERVEHAALPQELRAQAGTGGRTVSENL